jgi:hypothetical protein
MPQFPFWYDDDFDDDDDDDKIVHLVTVGSYDSFSNSDCIMKLLFFQKNAPIFVVMHTSYTQYAIPV